MKKILLLMTMILAVSIVKAQTYTSIADGNWGSSTTWSCVGGGCSTTAPTIIGAGVTVNILHSVIYNMPGDMEISGSLVIGTSPAGGGDTLRFPNDGSTGTGRSIIVKSSGYLGVFNGGIILPIFLTNGTTNNSGNIKNEGGRCEYFGSLAEVAQNWESLGSGSRRKFQNSCLKAGENYKNEGTDTLITVCIEIGAHGSTIFENKGTIRALTTSVLWQGTSGSFVNTGSSTIESLGGNPNTIGFSAIRVIGGNLQNDGTWNTRVLRWCATSGSTGTFNPALPAQNCAFFTDNNNQFSKCIDCGPQNAPLPVLIKSFTAARNHSNVILKWETIWEQNCSGFAVERNINGTWQQVAFVASQAQGGNSSDALNYQYIDLNNSKGISQYRIRQVDFDDKSKYSEVRLVRGDGQIGKIIVYPNPTMDGKVNVSFEDASVVREVSVIDMSGRMIKQMKAVTNNSITIDNLTPGMYTLRVVVPETGEQTVQKIVVNKR